jgi:hypothetical protein
VVENPYIKPQDSNIVYTTSQLSIPKKVILTITQNSCIELQAQLRSPGCAPLPSGSHEQTCNFNFNPYISVYDLPQIIPTTNLYGAPIGIDITCDYITRQPNFTQPSYSKIEAYFDPSLFEFSYVLPFIDGVGYDIQALHSQTKVKIHTAANSETLREWLVEHFRFLSVNIERTEITKTWCYTDIYWYPFDFCEENNIFSPEPDTVYVKLIPS